MLFPQQVSTEEGESLAKEYGASKELLFVVHVK